MANNNRKFVVSLEIDSKTAEQQIKTSSKNIEKILANIGNASDKMTYFKELANYIGQIDQQLNNFKKTHSEDVFNKMFGGLDSNLQKQMQDLFNTTKDELSAVDELRQKITSAKATEVGRDEAKALKAEVEALYKNLGRADEINISNKLGPRRMLEEAENALNNFATTWKDVNNKIAGGFNFGTGSGISSDIQKKIDELNETKDKLQKILDDISSSKDTNVSLPKGDKKQLEWLQELVKKYKEARIAKEDFEKRKDINDAGYTKAVAEYVNAAKQLKSAFDSDPDGDKFGDESSDYIANQLDTYEEAEKGLNNFYNNQKEMLSKISSLYASKIQGINDEINKLMSSPKNQSGVYDELSVKLKEFIRLQKQLDSPDISSEDYDDLSDQLYDLQQEIVLLNKVGDKVEEVDDILSNLAFEKLTEDEALEKLASTLGIVKKNAKEAKDAINGIDGSGIGTSGTKTQGGGTGSSETGSNGVDNKITNIDFSTLETTIKSEISAIANKLDGILQVKLVDDNSADIQQTVAGMKLTLENIGAAIDTYKTSKQKESEQVEVDNMKDNLRQLLKYISDVNNQRIQSGSKVGRYQQQETTASIFSDGSIVTNYGEDGTVPWDRMISVLLSNLSKSSLMDIHSHPWGTMEYLGKFANDAFSGSSGDLNAFRRTKELGTQIASMITGNIMRTFDVSKLTNTQMTKFISELSKIEQDIPNRPDIQDYVEYKNGSRYFKRQSTLEEQHKVTEIFDGMMYEAFSKIGISKDQVDQDIFKKYDLTNEIELTNLATRLVKLSSASQSAINPVERLSQIISAFGGNVNTKKAESVFESFKKGELSAADVFNKLTNDLLPVDQDTINSLNRIDSANADSPTLSHLSQVISILSSINSTLGSIDLAIQQDSEQKLNTAMKDILDIVNGQESRYLKYRTESDFDEKNISQYKVNDIARNASSQASNTMFDIENARIFGSVKDIQSANNILSEFYSALFNIKDAMKQIDLFEYRESDLDVSQKIGKIRQRLERKYNSLIGEENIYNLLSVLSGVKENIRDKKSQYGLNDSVGTAQVDLDVTQVVNALQDALRRIDIINTQSSNFDQDIDEQSLQSLFSTEDDNRLDGILSKLTDAINELNVALQTILKLDDSENTDSTDDQSNELYKALNNVLSDVSTESTLSKISGLLTEIVNTLNVDTSEDSDKNKDDTDSLPKLIASLGDAVTELKNVANGIVQHQKDQQTNYTDASNRIQKNHGQLSDIASNAAATTDGYTDEVKIDKMRALADGVVAVEGAVKDTDGVWKGFIYHINEAGEAINKGIGANTAYAKSLNMMDQAAESTAEFIFDNKKNETINYFEDYRKEAESSMYITDEFKQKLSDLNSALSSIEDVYDLNEWKKDFTEFNNEFGWHRDAQKNILNGKINAITAEAKAAIKGLDLDTLSDDADRRAQQEAIIKGFEEMQIASYVSAQKIKENQNIDIDALKKTKQELLELINAYRIQYEFINSGGKSGKNYGNTAVIRETTRYNKLQQYATDSDAGFKDSGVFNSKLQEYINAYNKLIAVREKLASKSELTDRDVQEFNDAKQAAANYGKELEKMITKSQKLASNSFQMGIIGSDIDVDDALSRKQALTDFVTQMHDANESTIKFSNNYQECMFKMKNSDGTWTRMTAVLDKTSNKMYSTAGEVTKYGTAIGEFVGALKGEFLKLGRYMIASFGFEEVVQAFRTGITYVKEIDDALTELKKVTNETDAGYERFLQTMSKTAAVVGSTVAELTTMAAEWARLGYSMQQAASLAESTAILLNVSEFEDATQASEALISTIQAFGYAADDSMHVVDVLNEVGNNFAVSSDGIATALQNSASALMAGGNDLEQATAMIAAANKVVQDPSQVGR